MAISKLQRRSLQMYVRFHDTPPTLTTLMRRSLPRVALIAALCSLGATLYYWMDFVQGVGFMLGVFVGVLTMVVGQGRVFLKLWPVFSQVMDWARIQALLAESK
jgi:hypothetical protein